MHLGKKVREGIAIDSPDEAPITIEEPAKVRRFWEKPVVAPVEEPTPTKPEIEPEPIEEPDVAPIEEPAPAEPEKAPAVPEEPATPEEPEEEPEPVKVEPTPEKEPEKDPLFPDYVPDEWPERITDPSEQPVPSEEPVKSN